MLVRRKGIGPHVAGLRSVEVSLASTDIRAQGRIGGTQDIDLFAAVATEQSDRHFVVAVADDPPRTAGDLPALQNLHGIDDHACRLLPIPQLNEIKSLFNQDFSRRSADLARAYPKHRPAI
jgi:hypothetical protein